MLDRFGPWSSALGDGMSPHLDTFWKRRLSLLDSTRTARFAPTRRDGFLLGLLAIAAFGLPTLHLASAQSPNPDKYRGPSRIYVRANFNNPNDGQSKDLSGLFAIDPETGTRTKLVDDLGYRVRVSPDGRTLAISKSGWSGGRQIDDVGIWTIDSEGRGEKRKIADFGGTVSWSPDSKQIIVSRGLTPITVGDEDKLHETWRMNADGSGATRLPIPASDEVDDWSPDGRWVVTVSDRKEPKFPNYQLYVMHLDGTDQRLITEGVGGNVYPRFSPDGKQVAYLYWDNKQHNLRVVNTDGSGRRVLINEENDVSHDFPVWSPDGKSIAYRMQTWERDPKDGHKFMSVGKSKPMLGVIDADGKNPRTIKLPPALYIESPDWR